MKKELQEQIYSKYPAIFRERVLTMDKTAMCWGLQCDDGWYDLIDSLCARLEAIRKASGILTVANTVKEKLAGLRFYFGTEVDDGGFFPVCKKEDFKVWDEIIWAVVGDAETKSEQTCEMCGGHGYVHAKGTWLKTLCSEHAEQEGYKLSDWPWDENEKKPEQVETVEKNVET